MQNVAAIPAILLQIVYKDVTLVIHKKLNDIIFNVGTVTQICDTTLCLLGASQPNFYINLHLFCNSLHQGPWYDYTQDYTQDPVFLQG